MEAFIRYLRDSQQLSQSSIEYYARITRYYFAWLHGRKLKPWKVVPEQASDYVAYLKMCYGPATVGHHISCLRHFYRWAFLQGHSHLNPFEYVKRPPVPRRLPRYLTRAELKRLLSANKPYGPRELRDRAVIFLICSTGCRASEVVNVNCDDLRLDERPARVILYGKGQKERIGYLAGVAAESIEEYLQFGRPYFASPHCNALFVGQRGNRLTRDRVREIVYRAAARAGLDGVYPHLLRHTFATMLLEAGVDVRYVQTVLGHASLATTQVYTHVADSTIARLMNEYHPIAALEDAREPNLDCRSHWDKKCASPRACSSRALG